MTCDTGRPCQRCVQRGLAGSCEDAPRKKKKYLADVPPTVLSQAHYQSTALQPSNTTPASYVGTGNDNNNNNNNSINNNNSHSTDNTIGSLVPRRSQSHDIVMGGLGFPNHQLFQQTPSLPPPITSNLNQLGAPVTIPGTQHGTIPPIVARSLSHSVLPTTTVVSHDLNNDTVKQRKSNFLSSAADLEYSTLSSILQDNFMHTNHSTSTEATPNSVISPVVSPQVKPKVESNSVDGFGQLYPHGQRSPYFSGSPSPTTNGNHHNITNGENNVNHTNITNPSLLNPSKTVIPRKSNNGREITSTYTSHLKCDESINQYILGPTGSEELQMYPDIINAIEQMKQNDPSVYHEKNKRLALSFAVGVISNQSQYKETTDTENSMNNLAFKEPEEIYEKVKKPFSYTPGYHLLIAYLRKRFPKEMLVKMAESMAVYRPSFIATTNLLKEGDLIFMEQCFQRTLLTYDNFISVSGTPTIVWRRTGEIAYVGNEFCMLTGWPREMLMSKKKTFIVELLDDKSVLEYFQLFLHIAFGDFLGATMTECTLLTPKKDVKIRTGCMWTLKRDVFGIPMMIIGNFLPIL